MPPDKTRSAPLPKPPEPMGLDGPQASREASALKPAAEPSLALFGAGPQAVPAVGRERLSLMLQRTAGNAATGKMLAAEKPAKTLPSAESPSVAASEGQVERDPAALDQPAQGRGMVADPGTSAALQRRRGDAAGQRGATPALPAQPAPAQSAPGKPPPEPFAGGSESASSASPYPSESSAGSPPADLALPPSAEASGARAPTEPAPASETGSEASNNQPASPRTASGPASGALPPTAAPSAAAQGSVGGANRPIAGLPSAKKALTGGGAEAKAASKSPQSASGKAAPGPKAGGAPPAPAAAGPGGGKSGDGAAEAAVPALPSGPQGAAESVVHFVQASPTAKAAHYQSLGKQASQGFEHDRQGIQDATPEVTAHAPGKAAAPKPAPQVQIPPPPASEPLERPLPSASVRKADSGGQEVEVDAGSSPRFQPQPGSDTAEMVQEEESAKADARAQQSDASQKIRSNPGEKRIQPAKLSETRQLEVPVGGNSVATEQDPSLAGYLAAPIPGNVRKMTDDEVGPVLETALSESKAKADKAMEKRDVEYQAKVAETQKQAQEAGDKAESDQRTQVEKTRAQVRAKKEGGLAEGRTRVEAVDSKISQKRRDEVSRINTHITAEEEKADKKLHDVEEEAKTKRGEAEDKVEEERRRTEKEEEDKAWYEEVADFVADLWDAFTDFVADVFNALRDAVNTLIDAARDAVKGIIDAVSTWVKDAITAFASVLKGLVDTLVGTFFPELAERINAAIDGVVEEALAFVDKVAEKLKAQVDALFDTLKKFANAVITFYESMVMGAIQVMGAILTGNFADIPKIVFLNSCRAVGLPGEQLLSTLEKAADKFMYVIQHPGEFFSNLASAVKKGFGQFRDNFGKHIVTALTSWLFGKLGEAGIKIPSEFSVASVFDIVRQVLGLTYEFLRSRAVAILGEDKVELIERVGGYIQKLFTEGPAALWQEFKDYLGDLKATIMEQASEWIVTTIVKKAILKVASMLVPGGGFVQAIISIYETVKFFIEKIQQIAAVVNSVLDSIYQIAKGAIGAAANFIENTMVSTMSLVVDFLARLVGLGGIGAKIREIIDKLRTPVRKAADFVIKGAAKLVSKGWEALKGTFDGDKDTGDEAAAKGNETEEETDEKGKGRRGTIADLNNPPAKEPRSRGEQLSDLESANMVLSAVARKEESTKGIAAHFPRIKKRYGLTFIGYEGDQDQTSISVNINPKTKFRDFNNNVLTIDAAGKEQDIVKFTSGSLTIKAGKKSASDTVGMKMSGRIITPYHGKGSSPSSAAQKNIFTLLPTMSKVDKGLRFGKNIYVKGHLLNDNLGGKGSSENLFPITGQANRDHERLIEADAKRLVNEKGRFVTYEVEVTNIDNSLSFPKFGLGAVNADLKCTLAPVVLQKSGTRKPSKSKTAVVKSRFVADSSAKVAKKDESTAKGQVKDEDFAEMDDFDPGQVQWAPSKDRGKRIELSPKALDWLDDFFDEDDFIAEVKKEVAGVGGFRAKIAWRLVQGEIEPADLKGEELRQVSATAEAINRHVG